MRQTVTVQSLQGSPPRVSRGIAQMRTHLAELEARAIVRCMAARGVPNAVANATNNAEIVDPSVLLTLEMALSRRGDDPVYMDIVNIVLHDWTWEALEQNCSEQDVKAQVSRATSLCRLPFASCTTHYESPVGHDKCRRGNIVMCRVSPDAPHTCPRNHDDHHDTERTCFPRRGVGGRVEETRRRGNRRLPV